MFAFKINYDQSDDEIVPALYNGNIAETFWKSNTDNVLRKYSYRYDGLNRLKKATYQKPNCQEPVTYMYDEQMDYDKNGNIQHMNRNGDFDADESNLVFAIDQLEYTYHTDKKNQLMRVQDFTTSSLGFKDDDSTPYAPDDYTYDNFGNMISDTNKEIASISYNHLNLPVEIIFVSGDKIKYLYNAAGQKVRKTVTISAAETVTDYQNGFQYTDGKLSFFLMQKAMLTLYIAVNARLRKGLIMCLTTLTTLEI
ncbi:MAG: hypothetical protein M0D53_11070 [Flavobacterium sp. JAD_PAG50586_2]|nr:MAG: hypothetical protein M0D53_11070 [Flavobacterium sp. JAD_PAG50586_2]